MEQKTRIRSLYVEFFQGYGAGIRLFRPDFRPISTYKQSYTLCHSSPQLSLLCTIHGLVRWTGYDP
jgi:hypothetical protein